MVGQRNTSQQIGRLLAWPGVWNQHPLMAWTNYSRKASWFDFINLSIFVILCLGVDLSWSIQFGRIAAAVCCHRTLVQPLVNLHLGLWKQRAPRKTGTVASFGMRKTDIICSWIILNRYRKKVLGKFHGIQPSLEVFGCRIRPSGLVRFLAALFGLVKVADWRGGISGAERQVQSPHL